MHQRRTLLIPVCLSIYLLLSACSAWRSPPATAEPTSTVVSTTAVASVPTPTEAILKGTVSIWHSWDEARLPGLLKAIAAFQAQYPDVVFDIQFVPSLDLKASYEIASSEGYAPLVMIGPANWGPEMFNQGWIADISGFVSEELIETLNPPAVGASRYRNALISLPVTIEGVVLYRNSSIIFDKAVTIDDLVSVARQTTGSDAVGAYLERSFYFSGGHLSGLGGSLMDSEGYPAFNDEYGVRWINLLRKLALAGPTEFFGDNDLQYFIENRAGYIIESTRQRNRLVEALGEVNVSIDPWPITQEGSLSGYVEAEAIYLSPEAVDQSNRAALEFVAMLLSPESQSALAEGGAIPAMSASAAFAPGSQASIRNKLIQEAMVALEDGVTYPVLPEMVHYPGPLDIALQATLIDGAPAEAALQTAEDSIRAALQTALVSMHVSAVHNP